jgi:large subunit ribosomal protein L25
MTGIEEQHQMAKTAAPTQNNLTATVRTETGKGASRRARRAGQVPAVLYGHGSDPQHLLLSGHDFAAVLRHSGTNAVLTLDIDGKEQLALTKAIDIHPIRRSIQHADLLVVRRGEKVHVEVNVVVEGEAASGTLVTQDSNTIEIEADALSIPQQLTISVEGAEIGTQFTAGSIELPSGVTLVSDPEMLVVNVVAAPTAEDLEAEGAGEEGEAAEAAEGEAAEGAGEEGGGEESSGSDESSE